MALVRKTAGQGEFKEGTTVKGYLVQIGQTIIKGNPVPKVMLQEKPGSNAPKTSYLLGAAALDSLESLTIGAWTEITKGKKQTSKTDPTKSFCPYDIDQDDEKKL